MKFKILFIAIILQVITMSLINAQQRVKVNRWASPVFGDFTSIPESKSTDDQLIAAGYTSKIFQYEAFLTRPAGNNVAVVNRWEMPYCKDFILIAEHEISDAKMIEFGYKNKQFVFYAYRTKPASGAFVAVNRWVNALPAGNSCKDFTLSIAEHELTHQQLTSFGYTSKMVQFYVPDPRQTNATGTFSNIPYRPSTLASIGRTNDSKPPRYAAEKRTEENGQSCTSRKVDFTESNFERIIAGGIWDKILPGRYLSSQFGSRWCFHHGELTQKPDAPRGQFSCCQFWKPLYHYSTNESKPQWRLARNFLLAQSEPQCNQCFKSRF